MNAKKSNKANLEKKRGLFFEIGLILSLSFVFLAFEWTTVRTSFIDWDKYGKEITDEELAIITNHEKKKLEIPKPNITRPIEIVPDEIEPDENLEINVEITDGTFNILDNIMEEGTDEEIEEPAIFTVVEVQPEFPGGLSALYKYLSDNINYPIRAKEVGIQGPVHVSFVVWNDGSIRKVQVLRGIGGGCDEEAARVIESMPNWKPGKQRTKAVNVQMVIPIVFNLSN